VFPDGLFSGAVLSKKIEGCPGGSRAVKGQRRAIAPFGFQRKECGDVLSAQEVNKRIFRGDRRFAGHIAA